jgi:hypothetical protein
MMILMMIFAGIFGVVGDESGKHAIYIIADREG